MLKLGAERDICTPQAAGTGYTSLFDGTLDSLAGWRQASAGSFARQADCSLKTVGNAGMLWWPGERFDNYSLKLVFAQEEHVRRVRTAPHTRLHTS